MHQETTCQAKAVIILLWPVITRTSLLSIKLKTYKDRVEQYAKYPPPTPTIPVLHPWQPEGIRASCNCWTIIRIRFIPITYHHTYHFARRCVCIIVDDIPLKIQRKQESTMLELASRQPLQSEKLVRMF